MLPFVVSPIFAPFLFLLEEIGMVGDLWFVIKILVFSYLIFQLYLMFRDSQVIFGIASLVLAYFIFVHGVSIVVLAIIFVVFVVLGNHLQMVIAFGLEPILGVFGLGKYHGQYQAEELDRLQKKLEKGQELSGSEMQWFEKTMTQQQNRHGGGYDQMDDPMMQRRRFAR